MSRRGERRRGAALVLVLIFSVGLLMLMSTMLTITNKTAEASGEIQRHRNLQAVLKAGIASAVNEINRHGALPTGTTYDPDNGGVGVLLGASNAGVPVTVTDDSGATMTLGFYRTTVTTEAGRQVLRVVAAWPSFAEPAPGELDRRMFAAAEMDVALHTDQITITTNNNPGGPFRPINVVGVDGSDLTITVDGNPKINITGEDLNPSGHLTPTTANVPAANVDKGDSKGELLTDLIQATNGGNTVIDTFTGADPSDVNGTITSDPTKTLTNNESTVFNEDTLTAARTAYKQQVRDDVNDALSGSSGFSLHVGGTLDGGGKGKDGGTVFPGSGAGNTIVVQNGLQIEGSVSGSGTLIIRDSLTVKGDFTWEGDIIIAGYDDPNVSGDQHEITNNSIFTMDSGAKINVKGNVIQLGNSTVTYTDQSSGGGSDGNAFDGAFLMLANDNSTVNVIMKNGSNTGVEGVFTVFSEKIVYKAEQGSKTTIRSLNLVTPDTDADNDNDVDIILENGSDTGLIYDNTQVVEAVTPILPILGATIVTTTTETINKYRVDVNSYWEKDPRSIYADQQADVDAGTAMGWQRP